jgi:hypothetical protein
MAPDFSRPAPARCCTCATDGGRDAAARLARKYAALSRLQAQQRAYMAAGTARLQGTAQVTRHGVLAAVAAAFPGSLRELDRLTPQALRCRWRIARGVAAGACWPRWLAVVWAYHGSLHAALAWRRWSRLSAADPQLVRTFACWYEGATAAAGSLWWGPRGGCPTAPAATAFGPTYGPGAGSGLLLPWVRCDVMRRFGLHAAALDAALWGEMPLTPDLQRCLCDNKGRRHDR